MTRIMTADASAVTGAEFLEAILPGRAERRAAWAEIDRLSCIAAIQKGDTFGFPPGLVERCRAELAEAERLVDAAKVQRRAA